MPKIDMTDVDIKTLLPEGIYRAEIVKVETVKTKTGSHGCKVEFKITSGEYENMSVTEFISLKATVAWKWALLFDAISYPYEKGVIDFDEDDLIGKLLCIELEVVEEEYENKKGEQVTTKKNKIVKYINMDDLDN